MSPAHYSRISTESDEEGQSTRIAFKGSPTHKPLSKQTFRGSSDKSSSPWTCECISRLLVLFVLFLIAIGFAINRFPDHAFHTHGKPTHHDMEAHHHAVYTKAAVASGLKQCSTAGVDILRQGGTAVDAAIASMLCQGVVEPEYSGIGGGFFMTIFNKSSGNFTVIDAREVAPKQSTKYMLNKVNPLQGPNTVGVPGALKGMSLAYEKFGGGVPWKSLFEHAINKANKFLVNAELAQELLWRQDVILNSSGLCDIYCDSSRRKVKKVNDTVTNKRLAETLTEISEKGADVLYNGKMAENIANEFKKAGGILTVQDLKDYKAIERKATKMFLPNANLTLVFPPIPSGGPLLGMMLAILDKFNITKETYNKDKTVQFQRTVEAFKHAFGAKTHFGDPSFAKDAEKAMKKFLSPEYIEQIKQKIKDNETFTDPEYYGALPQSTSSPMSSTMHVSVLAPNGDAVSVTTSVNYYFGSGFISPSTGILFNDDMADFITQIDNPKQQSPNFIQPGKRAQSSESPCMLYNQATNDAVFIIGAAGGPLIPTAIAQTLIRLLYFGFDELNEGIEGKRLHHQLFPNSIYHEADFNESILDGLREIGHIVTPINPRTISYVNGVKNHISHVHAFSDERHKGAGADGW